MDRWLVEHVDLQGDFSHCMVTETSQKAYISHSHESMIFVDIQFMLQTAVETTPVFMSEAFATENTPPLLIAWQRQLLGIGNLENVRLRRYVRLFWQARCHPKRSGT